MRFYPNILIVKGTGRNVGKTVSACKIIQHLAATQEPVGIKISPHFHDLNGEAEYIHRSDDFVIVEERNISQKDSSRMLQAGAKKVFYIQCKNNHLPDAMNVVFKQIQLETPVVVESGGLYDFLEPAILVHIAGQEMKKESKIRNNSKVIRLLSGEVQQLNWDFIQFINGKFITDA